jgi:hypothetical protein
MLAATKASMSKEVGRSVRLMPATTSPVNDAAPNFLVHQTTRIKTMNASRSHRNGIRVSCQNIGDMSAFRMPHRAEHVTIAAISLDVKYVNQ